MKPWQRGVVLLASVALWLAPRVALGACTTNEDCEDGLFCTTNSCDTSSGDCVAVTTCPAAIVGCLVYGSCDEVNDQCLVIPDDSLCDDGVFCNGLESCDGETGNCVAVSSCPPFGGCLAYRGCDEINDACLFTPDDSLCDDGTFCNGLESCDGATGECVAMSACPAVLKDCLVVGCDEPEEQCRIDTGSCEGLLVYEFSVANLQGSVSGTFAYDPSAGDTQPFGSSAAISIDRASGVMIDYPAAGWDDALRASDQELGLNTLSPSGTFFTFAFDAPLTLAGPLPLEDFLDASTFTSAWLDDDLLARGSFPETSFGLALVPEPTADLLTVTSLAALTLLARRRPRA